MDTNFDFPALRVLEMLRKEAPKMELSKACEFVKEYQSMRDELVKFEFITVTLFNALGFNENGWLSDKEMAAKLKDMSDETWAALSLASMVHTHNVCSPFTPKDWKDKLLTKLKVDKNEITRFKTKHLDIVFPPGEKESS